MNAASLTRARRGRAEWRVQTFDVSNVCRRRNSLPPRIEKKGVPAGGARGAAAKMLEFELAAALRDQIIELRGK